jgi:hypothetical protein
LGCCELQIGNTATTLEQDWAPPIKREGAYEAGRTEGAEANHSAITQRGKRSLNFAKPAQIEKLVAFMDQPPSKQGRRWVLRSFSRSSVAGIEEAIKTIRLELCNQELFREAHAIAWLTS